MVFYLTQPCNTFLQKLFSWGLVEEFRGDRSLSREGILEKHPRRQNRLLVTDFPRK